MSVQVSKNESRKPFILDGSLTVSRGDQVLLTDAGRVSDLVFGTLLSKTAATGKWGPFTDETAVDGTALPSGVYIGNDIAAADIVAGDVSDINVLLGGDAKLDVTQLVIENGKLLTTVIAAGTVEARTVEDELRKIGLFMGDVEDTTSFEN